MATRPSFILFITDQQQAGMLGCAGDPVVQTPNIDSIAAAGTRFDRFHVAMPSCMPNRASIMTGLYPSVNGVRFNGIPLPQDAQTFPVLLRQAGYRTALVGKGHLQPILEPYPAQDTEGWWRQEVDGRGNALSAPYYGYDHVSIVTGHGDQCGGHYETWLKKRSPKYRDYLGPDNQLPHNYSCPQAVRTRLPEELYPTNYIADQAIAFLDSEAKSDTDAPFLLVVSFPDPHHPFNPPGRYWDMYDPAAVTLPTNFDASDIALPHLAAARAARTSQAGNRNGYGAVSLDEREAREAIALTYGMITMIDDAIGRVQAHMKKLGLDDDTVQIFTSDHGDLLGDHGLMLKGPLHYQSLIRVPFILFDPQKKTPSQTDDRLLSAVDIAPSLCHRAGIDPPPGTHGLSLFDADAGRSALLIEDAYQSPTLCFADPLAVRTLVTQHHRLTVFRDTEWGELYDLDSDPSEISNLWSEPDHAEVRQNHLHELINTMMAAMDHRSDPKSLA